MRGETKIALSLALSLTAVPAQGEFTARAAEASTSADTLDEVVVTAPKSRKPLTVVTNPKAPRQPIPAHDGADYLKSIPGFSVIRKGGTDGDPVFRGMAGSRLNILIDGESILGGCPNRMDPPTAYIFPGAYDKITVLKGPTVEYGAGASAATVLFERTSKRFDKPGIKFNGTATLGSFGRNDEMLDLRAGMPDAYARFTGTRSHTNDYKDGAGNSVHSAYTRWSANAALGWTPDDDTLTELNATKSDGRAAYADRAMDGVKFARENIGLKFRKEHISSLLNSLEAQAYYTYVDHVMDNYTLRTFKATAMMPNPAAINPDRTTTGGKLVGDLMFGDATDAKLGIDYQSNIHTNRYTMNQTTTPYQSLPHSEDARFRDLGIFIDATHDLSERDVLKAGIRVDNWHAEDKRQMVQTTMMATATNPTYGATRQETQTSGYGRYEHELNAVPATLYIGIGRTVRFPDYWEMIKQESLTTVSAFYTRPEKTNQVDAGVNFNGKTVSASVSVFYNKIKDYNLIQSNVSKATTKGTRLATVTRNVNATTWGGEADLSWAFIDNWKASATLSYVHGDNDTDNRPLGQMPPLEGRLGLDYDNKVWSAGMLWRVAAAQNRYAVYQGNIVGQDLGRTGGFGVFSLHAGWKPVKGIQLTVGADNVFDKLYAEHISRSGSTLVGYATTTRVNEMGRSLWMSVNGVY